MDIKLPINLLTPSALNNLVENPLNLKVGEKLDVKVISALIKSETNFIALKLGNNSITVQSNQAIKLIPGQDLQLQVTKTTPVLEFVIIVSSPELKKQAPSPDLRLKLIPPSSVKQKAELTEDQPLPFKQPLAAKIVALTDSKIKLQVFIDNELTQKPQKTADPGVSKPSITITIDRSQIQTVKALPDNPSASTTINKSPRPETAPVELKVGQPLIVEISSKDSSPVYKLSAPASPTAEEKITDFIKLYLPRHEASPILINQLMKELPQLLKASSVPEALKQLANKLIQNLPDRQQLTESSGLKQAIVNTGIFLEAKMAELKENPELAIDLDFKADLLKLGDQLKKEVAQIEQPESQDQSLSTLKNLQQKTENSLAKIILDQLISLPKEDSPKQIWFMDIPYIDRGHAETVGIKITRDTDHEVSSEDNKAKWSVTITMNPPGLGTIQCLLSYHDETVNTFFRSQQSQTTELINNHLDKLKLQFEEAGLKPGVIALQEGLQTIKTTILLPQKPFLMSRLNEILFAAIFRLNSKIRQ